MRWLNKYHRGFNRLWLVLSCFPFFILLLEFLLSGDYKANRYVDDRRVALLWDKRRSEDIIAARVQEQWRKGEPWKEKISTKQKVVEDSSNRPTLSKGEQEIEIPNYWEQARREAELTPEDRFKRSIIRSVRSMKAAKSFTDKELTTIVDLAVEAEKTYPSRVWEARWRGLGHLLIGFIVSISIFGFGHGLFCLIVWIIRGFR